MCVCDFFWKQRNLRPLAYLSSFGFLAVAALFLITVGVSAKIMIDHFYYHTAELPNTVFYTDFGGIGYGLGILLASFSGHAVFPNIKASMIVMFFCFCAILFLFLFLFFFAVLIYCNFACVKNKKMHM